MKPIQLLLPCLAVILLSCGNKRYDVKKNPERFSYTFSGYLEKDGKEYIKVNASQGGRDTTLNILVTNWHKLEGIKRTKGISYGGAGLIGLEFDVVEKPEGTEFIYKDLKWIFD